MEPERLKESTLSLEEIRRRYCEEKVQRLISGYPLRFRRTKPRDPFKSKAMVQWLLENTPPAEEILSGRAFDRLFRKE